MQIVRPAPPPSVTYQEAAFTKAIWALAASGRRWSSATHSAASETGAATTAAAGSKPGAGAGIGVVVAAVRVDGPAVRVPMESAGAAAPRPQADPTASAPRRATRVVTGKR